MSKRIVFNIITIVILALVIAINFVTLCLPLPAFDDISTFNHSMQNFNQNSGKVAMIVVGIYIISIILISVCIFKLKSKKRAFVHFIYIFIILFQIFIIAFGVFYKTANTTIVTLSILNVVLIIIALVVSQITIPHIIKQDTQELDDAIKKEAADKIAISTAKKMWFTNILSLIGVFSIFITPLYSIVEKSRTQSVVLYRILFGDEQKLFISIIAGVAILFTFFSLIQFVTFIASYITDKKRFVEKSDAFITFNIFLTFIFFATGLVVSMIQGFNGKEATTLSFIPVIAQIPVLFVFSYLKGKFDLICGIKINDEIKKEFKDHAFEPLIYLIILTIITSLILFVSIIKIDISAASYSNLIEFNGFNLLSNYASLESGYRMIAFVVLTILLLSMSSLILTISSYLSKSPLYRFFIKLTTVINVISVFLLGISGYYFLIAQEINKEMIGNILDMLHITIPQSINYTYNVTTDAYYLLFASLFVLIIMILRNSFRNDIFVINDLVNTTNPNPASNQIDEEPHVNVSIMEEKENDDFDPCTPFTYLDENASSFQIEKPRVESSTLEELIQYVVDYAKNSRLHLSYTTKDIATFISGLAATRLSILQGMSGTGKTSLPKIFTEAICGNCEIIEVESSWKDKNELLGYYNEFSMKYTPKKFTISLYKAAINPNVVTLIVLDEMNLSRIEYYFSDFLSLMESEEGKREIKLLNVNIARRVDGKMIEYSQLKAQNTIKIPSNIWFIGTANRDESTFVISDKVYDRAHTMNFTKRAPKVRDYQDAMQPRYFDYKLLSQLLTDAKTNGNFDCENSELIQKIEKLVSPYNISFGNRILKQIEEFVNVYKACFPNMDVEKEAIETILLSKVVAKLETKTIENKEKLISEFEGLGLIECADYIRQFDGE